MAPEVNETKKVRTMRITRKLPALCLAVFLLLSLLPHAAFASSEIAITQGGIVAKGGSKLLAISGAAASEVDWSSSDTTRATVDETGVVTGIKVGSVTITATLKKNPSVTATADLYVTNSWPYSVGWSGTYTAADNNAVTKAPIPTSSSKIKKVWAAAVGNGATAIVGDYVYTYDGVSGGGATTGGTFYKVNKNTGEIVERLKLGVGTGYQYSYTIYGDGLLYIGCTSAVMCIDLESFTLLWKATFPEQAYSPVQLIDGCLVTNGYVYNAVTGAQIKILEGRYSWANGAAVNGYYYVAGNGKLYAFDTKTWETKDSIAFEGQGAGVLHYNNRLYWGGTAGNVYSVRVNGGEIDDASLTAHNWGYVVIATPVALNNRVYVPGTQITDTNNNTGYGAIGVFEASTLTLHYEAKLEGVGHKLQATPILQENTVGGNVVAGETYLPADSSAADTPQSSTAYVYVQDYASPSSIYVLKDTADQTNGTLQKLIAIEPANYAFEQFACDERGSIYCTNNSGFLVKYSEAEYTVPVPTFQCDLDVQEVIYGLHAKAASLRIVAEVTEGTLTYQWQCHEGDGFFTHIEGATQSEYQPPTDTVGTISYRCVVTNSNGNSSAKAYSKIAKITVRCGGDVNQDGRTDQDDVNVLRRYLAKFSVHLDKNAADVNGDGTVNLIDLIILSRYVAR